MVFNIGSQDAGVINNVAGNQWSQVTIGDEAARVQVQHLRTVLERAGLSPDAASEAQSHVDEAAAEMKQATPRKAVIAARLKKLTQILISAGALARTGGALAGPLGALAGWLGGLGKPIMEMLGSPSPRR